MVENTKDNIKMIKNTVLAFTPGLMGENIMEIGRKESSMVKVNISYHQET